MQQIISDNDSTSLSYRRSITVLLILFALSFTSLFMIGGGPVTNDELKYLNLSTFTVAAPRLLNRYTHIYLQKIFIELAGDPFRGAQLYWAFSVSLTLAAIFWLGQMLARWRGLWTGLTAVLIFLAQPLIFRFVGTTYADFTVMMLITLGAVVFLHSLNNNGRRQCWLYIAQGVLFLLAVKSKETGIIVGLFPIGLVIDALSIHSPNEGWKAGLFEALLRSGYWLAGLILAMLLLMTADAAILGDFWFSVRPSSFDALAAMNTGVVERVNSNWFSLILASDLGLPFVFFLLALAITVHKEKPLALRLLYCLPLLLITFLLVTMLGGNTRVIPRHLIPIIPILCACAASYLDLSGITMLRNLISRWFLAAGGATALLLIVAGFLLRDALQTTTLLGWTPHLIVVNIYYPAILLTLMAAFVFLPSEGLSRARVMLAIFLASLAPMLGALPNNLLFSSRVFENRIYPIAAFSPYMTVHRNSVILMSEAAGNTLDNAGRIGLLPLFFGKAELDHSQPMFVNWPTNRQMDYAIAESADLERWRQAGTIIEGEVITEKSGRFVLICVQTACQKKVNHSRNLVKDTLGRSASDF